MRILVVDDDPIFRELAVQQLGAHVEEIAVAEDGALAWKLVREREFDLAIIDLGLPELDGFSLISCIRGYPKSKHMPVVVITAREDSQAVHKAFQAGATSFMTKPVQWTLFGYHIKYMMRQVALERESRKARLQARAESRIKDIVISRVNTTVRDRLERLIAYAAAAETELNGTPRKNVLAHSIGAVVEVADDMSDTLSQIVHFSQALAGSLNLDERRHSLQRLLRQVEASMNGQAARREVSLVIDASQPIEVECDATELCAAVSNLVLNAIQHTPRGYSVVVKTVIDEDKALLVRVEDDGPGIAPDVLAGLLSAHATTLPGSGKGDTLGLGLPLAKLIAEAHGGALHVQSAVGRGTTAIIQIPPDRIHLDDAVAA